MAIFQSLPFLSTAAKSTSQRIVSPMHPQNDQNSPVKKYDICYIKGRSMCKKKKHFPSASRYNIFVAQNRLQYMGLTG